VDVELLFYRDLLVALLASLIDPFLEIITQASKDDVTNIGAGHLPDLPRNRKAVHHLLMGKCELQDQIQLETLVLGHINDLDVHAVDGPKQ
jgi:hypothetical protein